MDEYLWPARHVAEHAYCPRLFHLMEIEGLFIPSADTERGAVVHRRVDRPGPDPGSANAAEPDTHTESNSSTDSNLEVDLDRPKSVRSLALSSRALGLTATLDLAEIRGNIAIPVEYRKGRPRRATGDAQPDDDPDFPPHESEYRPWPTDRVQIGLQAILLQEAGYQVPEGVLYYASVKRSIRIAVDDDLRNEALETLEAAKRTAATGRPLPLVNDPRCPRCSLQPICLPDEVNRQRDPAVRPRKIWPPRDDGIHVVAQLNGSRVGVRGFSVRVTDAEGTLRKEFPIANVESLSLLGNVQISTQALHVFADKGIPIAYLSPVGRLVAIVEPRDSVSAEIRRQQVRRFDDPAARLELARALVAAKISNQRTLLIRNHPDLDAAAPLELAREARLAAVADSLDSLRGHEGQAAAIYFARFGGIFRKEGLGGRFDAMGRRRRPPPDPVNSCLSMGYAMLAHECSAALRVAGLEPAVGAYHVSRPGRPALALDLMEPFRPLVADSVAILAFNRGELGAGHFQETASGCLFNDRGRRVFFDVYGRRMAAEVTHPAFGYRLSYRRMLILHARMIAAWLLGEVPSLSFLTTR